MPKKLFNFNEHRNIDSFGKYCSILGFRAIPAKIRKSIPCAFCGEKVMESRITQLDGKPACIPCCEQQQQLA